MFVHCFVSFDSCYLANLTLAKHTRTQERERERLGQSFLFIVNFDSSLKCVCRPVVRSFSIHLANSNFVSFHDYDFSHSLCVCMCVCLCVSEKEICLLSCCTYNRRPIKIIIQCSSVTRAHKLSFSNFLIGRILVLEFKFSFFFPSINM